MILIILVLLLFSIILLYHLCTNTPLIEPNDADDTADNLATNESSVAVTLAEKNGRDISILQSKIEEINNLKIQVKKNSEQVEQTIMLYHELVKRLINCIIQIMQMNYQMKRNHLHKNHLTIHHL